MARVFVSLASVAGFAGCAQLAGIEETNDRARAGNAVAVTRTSIGATVVTTPLDLTDQHATYLVANPGSASGFDRVPAGNAGPGRWTVDLPQPATVELTTPDVAAPIPRLFSSPNRELQVRFDALEHPDRQPTLQPAMLDLQVMLDAPFAGTEGFQIYTVGSWSQRALAAAELPVVDSTQLALAYDFNTSSSLSGRPALDRLTAQDAYLVLRYAGAGLTGVAVADPFEQVGGDAIRATMTAVPADQMLDVRIEPTRLITRYASARPAVAGLQMSWAVIAAPGFAVAPFAGPALQSGALAETDIGVTVNYGNPFVARQWPSVFGLTTTETRVYTPPGTTTPVTLSAGMSQFLEPLPGFALLLPAGLPELISLDSKPLSTDGQVIAAPSKFVEVTFIADSPVADMPNATLYQLDVFDLVPDAAGTGLDRQLVLAATSDKPAFQVPPETFQRGHNYTLRATCVVGGFPGAATGDFTTRSLPLAQSFLDSAVITVMP